MSRATRLIVVPLLLVVAAGVARAQSRDIDVVASDGAAIRASYYSPRKPGPAVILLHQCDMNRAAWTSLAAALAARGMHVLAPDYRGEGDSRSAPMDYAKFPGDFEAALAKLKSMPGVDGSRIAAGGASCGVDHAVELARRTGGLKALVLLSGPASDEGLAFIRTSNIPVFLAFSADEGGPLPAMKAGVAGSKNPATTIREFTHAGHGVPMFRTQATLLPELADWLAEVLR
jgi:dienelactone hydrolase